MIPGPPTDAAVNVYIRYREAGIDRYRARLLTIAALHERR